MYQTYNSHNSGGCITIFIEIYHILVAIYFVIACSSILTLKVRPCYIRRVYCECSDESFRWHALLESNEHSCNRINIIRVAYPTTYCTCHMTSALILCFYFILFFFISLYRILYTKGWCVLYL